MERYYENKGRNGLNKHYKSSAASGRRKSKMAYHCAAFGGRKY